MASSSPHTTLESLKAARRSSSGVSTTSILSVSSTALSQAISSIDNGKNAVVVELGAKLTKLGCAGEITPRHIIRTEFLDDNGRMVRAEEILALNDMKSATKTLEHYEDVLMKFLRYLFLKVLAPADRPIIVVESVFMSEDLRNAITKVIIEKLRCKSLIFMPSHVCCTFPFNCQNALVVDIGHSECVAMPVIEGVTLLNEFESARSICGKRLERRARELLQKYGQVEEVNGQKRSIEEADWTDIDVSFFFPLKSLSRSDKKKRHHFLYSKKGRMSNHLDDNFDPTFQSTSKKLILPTNRKSHPEYDNVHEEPAVNDFSSDELMRLLAFMEGEVQARDDIIEHLKKERAKILLAEAKYGKLSMNDPFAALRRDSAITGETIDEEKIVQMYESQVDQLDKMMEIQKKSQRNAAVLLVALEKKQYKLVKKLEADREAKIRYAKQGDDLVAHLEKERNQLQQQIEFHIEEKRKTEEAKDKMEMHLANEKKRHESIVLYLINERKQMLLKMHDLRVKAEQIVQQPDPNKPSTSNAIPDRALIEELKKEVSFLRSERESLGKTQKMMKLENQNLRDTVRGQETDLQMLRRNLSMTGVKMSIDKPGTVLPQLAPDSGSLIMINRGAKTASTRQPPILPPPGTRLPNSSTFPTEKSRLPRAPPPNTLPNRMSVGAMPTSSFNAPRTMSSPVKKTPVMGVSSTNVRRPQTATSSLPNALTTTTNSSVTPLTPELEQLEAAIQSMNVVSAPPTYSTAMAKRSSSLPREPNNNPSPARRQTMNGGGMHSSTTGVVSTRIGMFFVSLSTVVD
uniref:CortBP2 domain-containing protein n=1 Tax=Caenorhabditis japonica TaxID=281687 RepID=A0A8R1IB61_CAEJA